MIQRYARFWFFRKGSVTSFYTTFCVWFFKKKCYINSPYFIVPLLIEILGNMYIATVCSPGFKIKLIFLIKPFRYMTKNSRKKPKYLEKEKSFWSEIKSIFHHFKGLSVDRKCLSPEKAPLIKGEGSSLPSRLFYEPQLQYIPNQSESAKETVSPKIGKNIEMFVRFICMGTQNRSLIDINPHYQITMNQHKNWT